MTLELEGYQLFMILATLVGLVIGTVKVIWSRIEKGLSERHMQSEKSRADGFKRLEDQMQIANTTAQSNRDELQRLERDFLKFQADLPRTYVAREDYIRGQTVIEAKIDAVMATLKNVEVKQAVQGQALDGDKT